MAEYKYELILDSDGFFHKREIRTSVIKDAELAILDCVVEPKLTVNPVKSVDYITVPVIDDIYEDVPFTVHHAYQSKAPYDNLVAYVGLPYGFPLPKTDVIKNDYLTDCAGEDTYTLCPRKSDGTKSEENAIRPKNLLFFNSEAYDTYIMFKNIPINTEEDRIGPFGYSVKAYLFGVHKETHDIVNYALPNIYDSGQICTGNDTFKPDNNIQSLTTKNVNEVVKELLYNIHTTQINNDLRNGYQEELYAAFKFDPLLVERYRTQNKEEQNKMHQAIIERGTNVSKNYNLFHRSVSQEYITEFGQWLKSQKSS